MAISNNKTNVVLKNPHLWIWLVVLSLIISIYSVWPWRIYIIRDSVWQFFPQLSSLYIFAKWEASYKIFGLLFIAPLIYASLLFKWRSTLNISLLLLTALTPIILGAFLGLSLWTQYTPLLLLPGLIGIIINLELELRRRDKLYLIQREKEHKLYVSNIFAAEEKERKRIAQEIHDDTLQTLLAAASYAESIESPDSNITEKQENAKLVREVIIGASENLRSIALNLRPRLLDELGLIPALNWLVNTLNSENAINYELIFEGQERKLPLEFELSIFRIVQEALNNIKQHSKADKADVHIKLDDDSIIIEITDNGVGFYRTSMYKRLALKGQMGLIGMQERVESIGGIFKIYSNVGQGTRVFLKLNC